MTEKGERCRQHYQSLYERNEPALSKGRALDESLQHFLDQRPADKNLSAIDRAQGLATASFWLDVDAVAGSELASLASVGCCISIIQPAPSGCCTSLAITQKPSDGRFATRNCLNVQNRLSGLRCVRRSLGMNGKFFSVSVIACLISSSPLMS